jgi:hypothetical protein
MAQEVLRRHITDTGGWRTPIRAAPIFIRSFGTSVRACRQGVDSLETRRQQRNPWPHGLEMLSGRNTSCRHRGPVGSLREQASVALDRFVDAEMPLDIPALRRHCVEHRHTKLRFQRFDDVERMPRRPQQIDGVGAVVAAEHIRDKAMDLRARQLRHLVEIDIHPGHVEAVYRGIDEIFRISAVCG